MRKFFLFFAIGVIVLCGPNAYSGEVRTGLDNVDIVLGGQLRPRYELNDKNTVSGTDANHFFSQRSRLNVGIDAGGSIKGFVQFQDVRTWGEETSTLTDYNADNFDIHQAYVDLINFANIPFTLRIGRQEIILDGHRLVGSVNWTQQARSWDGVKLNANLGPALINLFGAKERENTGTGDSETAATRDKNFYGAWAKIKVTDAVAVSGTVLYQNDDSTDNDLNRATLGVRGTFKSGDIKGRVEGYLQTGDASSTTDAEAYMIGARLGYTFADVKIKPNITLWYDYLSGDSDTTDNKDKAFNTLYATNHKFYGFMDYFLNVPLHTTKKGLQDIAVKATIKPAQKVTLLAHFHHFLLAEDSALDGKKELGQELDLTLKWKYHKQLMIVTGYSHFFNKKLERALSSRGNNDTDWAYLMMDFKF